MELMTAITVALTVLYMVLGLGVYKLVDNYSSMDLSPAICVLAWPIFLVVSAIAE